MKKNNLLGIAVMLIVFLSSCGSGETKKKEVENKSTKLEVSAKMAGVLSSNFEVVDAVLKTSADMFGSKLLVEVKRTSNQFDFSVDDAQVCGVSSGKKITYCISADVLDKANVPIATNLEKYGYDSFEKCLSLNAGETIWFEFSLGYNTALKENPEKAKTVKLNSSLVGNGGASLSEKTTNNTDWDKVLKSYESYINQYIKLLKKAKKGDVSAITEYSKMMEKASDLSDKLANAGDDLTSSQIAKFVKLQTKLTNAVANM